MTKISLDENKKWFKEARFGMMVHFGLYSLLGGEWQGQRMGGTIGEWAQSYFKIPASQYSKLKNVFNPCFFNADEWIKLAADAGMKYFVITSKHHDGFALFNSAVSDYNSVNTPFGRDIIEECADACARHNIKLGLYYSQSLDWNHPDGGGYKAAEMNVNNMSWTNNWDWPDPEKKDYMRCYNEKIKPQVEEILKNYGELCLIWFDTPIDIPKSCSEELYSLVRKYQPSCLVNSRLGNGAFDYESSGDNEIPDSDKTGILYECCATLNDTWGYKSYDNNWKSAAEVKRIKERVNSLGANYLLNVGPDHLGRMPSPAVDILRAVGK